MQDYQSIPFFSSGHFDTILPHLLRQDLEKSCSRFSVPTPDQDFIEVDEYINTKGSGAQGFSKPIQVLLLHGLEGNSGSGYVTSLANSLLSFGAMVYAINFRGCAGKPNLKVRFYHSGATDDVATVARYLIDRNNLPLSLIGFSLGGNQCLKFLGELNSLWQDIAPMVLAGAAMSVPLDLSACSDTISQKSNRIYEKRFIASLSKKIMDKHRLMPNEPLLNPKNLVNIKKLKDFDEFYTAPIHGFESADAYYKQNSSLYFLPKIEKPTIIIQADNDPFLSPAVRAKQSNLGPKTDFVVTLGGGHCGWYSPKKYNQTHFWLNSYICNWLQEVIS